MGLEASRFEIGGRRQRTTRGIRSLIGQIEPLLRGVAEQFEEQRLFAVPLQLLIDLVAQRLVQHLAVMIPQKPVLMDVAWKEFLVEPNDEEGAKPHAACRHRIQYLDTGFSRVSLRRGRPIEHLCQHLDPFAPADRHPQSIQRPELRDEA